MSGMRANTKDLVNTFFHAPDRQKKFNICNKLIERQRAFPWQKWEFGFHVLEVQDLIQKMSEENLFKLIFLIIEKDKSNQGFFDKLDDVGIVSNIFQVLRDRGNEVQHCSKNQVDPSFDFRSDTPPNKDPDAFSETLKLYHKVLWSKELPSGQILKLSNEVKGSYLYFSNGATDLNFTSDCITHTYRNTLKMKSVIEDVPREDLEEFFNACFSIGGYTLFPGGKRDGFQTINQARGCNLKIVDRFDLTLECIRRQYLGITNPLANTLNGYWDFFELFCDFRGYVEFFLLQDLVDGAFERVKFHLPFDDEFPSRPFPKTVDEYLHYMNNTLTFIHRRTERMLNFSRSLSFDTGQF
jgi:hypothetical protein